MARLYGVVTGTLNRPSSAMKIASPNDLGFGCRNRRWMNKYKREAMAAFANPSNAKRKVDLAEIFAKIGEIGESLQSDK